MGKECRKRSVQIDEWISMSLPSFSIACGGHNHSVRPLTQCRVHARTTGSPPMARRTPLLVSMPLALPPKSSTHCNPMTHPRSNANREVAHNRRKPDTYFIKCKVQKRPSVPVISWARIRRRGCYFPAESSGYAGIRNRHLLVDGTQ